LRQGNNLHPIFTKRSWLGNNHFALIYGLHDPNTQTSTNSFRTGWFAKPLSEKVQKPLEEAAFIEAGTNKDDSNHVPSKSSFISKANAWKYPPNTSLISFKWLVNTLIDASCDP